MAFFIPRFNATSRKTEFEINQVCEVGHATFFFFSLSLPLWIYTLLSIIGLELSEFSEYGELVHHRPIILAELGNE